jgi:hypothetical protein
VSSNTAISNVTVVPVPTVAVSGPTAICIGNSATLTAGGATTYTWSTSSNATLIAISPTIATGYTLTGRTSGCTNTTAITVTVLSLPQTSISSQPSLCIGNSINLIAGGASSYTWNTTSNSPTIAVSPTATTSYTVVGQGTNGCLKSAVKTITVNPLPTLSVTGGGGVCPGNNAILQVSGATTYTWSNGLHAASILVTPTANTTYTVAGTSAAGCSNSAVTSVSISALPAITATVSSPAVCAGSSVTLGGVGAVTYTWTGGVTNNTAFVPTSTNSYTVTGTDANGCKNQTVTTITVNPLPTVTISPAAGIRICQGEFYKLKVGGASTYSWNNGTTADSLIVSPILTTTFVATGTDLNGCSSSASKVITVLGCVGIAGHEANSNFDIYPNPTSGNVSLSVSEDYLNENPKMEVYNVIGQVLIFEKVQQQRTEIDLSRFDKGIYFVRLSISDKVLVKRIVKD